MFDRCDINLPGCDSHHVHDSAPLALCSDYYIKVLIVIIHKHVNDSAPRQKVPDVNLSERSRIRHHDTKVCFKSFVT